MREIKFRIWDGEKMITPSEDSDLFILIHNSGYFELQDHENVSRVKTKNGMKDLSVVNSEGYNLSLMQYTGLNDKNGVEIYEWDIIECKNWSPSRFKVEFRDGGFCMIDNTGNWASDISTIEDSKGIHFEAIGNIYEHPHLLS